MPVLQHPDAEKTFKKNSVSRQELDARRQIIGSRRTSCAFCQVQKKFTDTKKCGRCRLVTYCSRECQSAHWKSHKEVCSPNATDVDPYQDLIIKFVHRLYINEHLMAKLDLFAIISMNLSSARYYASRYMIDIECRTIPVDIESAVDRDLKGEARFPEVEVMLYLETVTCKKISELLPQDRETLVKIRSDEMSNPSSVGQPIYVIRFTSHTCPSQPIWKARPIDEIAFLKIRYQPFLVKQSGLYGTTTKEPMTHESLINSINCQVRLDRENSYRLRGLGEYNCTQKALQQYTVSLVSLEALKEALQMLSDAKSEDN